MEIEDLKGIWQKQSESFKPRDTSELAAMLRGKSTSIVARLKRSVWFELIFTFVGGVALLIYAMMIPTGWLNAVAMSMVILFCLYSFYYYKKLVLLNRFDAGKENLKANLEHLITSMKSYLKFYRRSYAILYPFYFFLGLLFTAIDHGAEAFINRISRPEIILSNVVFAIVFFAGTMALTRWYLKKLYGNHLERLEKLLSEFDDPRRMTNESNYE